MIDYIHKDLYWQDSIDKQLKIELEDGTILDNSMIYSEEFELEESICSEDELRFGACEASCVKFRIFAIPNRLVGQKITISEVLGGQADSPMQIGKYKVASAKPTADRDFIDTVAYDSMYDIIHSDVAAWYNNQFKANTTTTTDEDGNETTVVTYSTTTLKKFRDSFFSHFGIEQVDVTLPNDGMVVSKTIEIVPNEDGTIGETLSGSMVIEAICELNGCFGHINRDGKFEYVTLQTISKELFPADDLFPRNDLYPASDNTGVVIYNWQYEATEYEDFDVEPITQVQIIQEDNDIGMTVGADGNKYIINSNFLTYSLSDAELETIGTNILSVVEKAKYTPIKANVIGNPCVTVGDIIKIVTNSAILYSYVINRTLKGCQSLTDEFESNGEEYRSVDVNSTSGQIKKLQGRSNVLEQSIDETRSTIANVEKGLKSEIKQTAESITSIVSSTQIKWDVSKYEENGWKIIYGTSSPSGILSPSGEKELYVKVDTGDSWDPVYDAENQKYIFKYNGPLKKTTETIQSSIEETEKSITASVNSKFENYSTTEEMNSAIEISKEGIESTVAKSQDTWETVDANGNEVNISEYGYGIDGHMETGEPYVYSETIQYGEFYLDQETGKAWKCNGFHWFSGRQVAILLNEPTYTFKKISENLSSEISQQAQEIVLKVDANGKIVEVALTGDPEDGTEFSVNADNINLTAADVINLLANGDINLTGKNISITSTNFSVDKDGNLDCNNGNITGGSIIGASISSSDDFKMLMHYNAMNTGYESYLKCVYESIYDASTGLVGGKSFVKVLWVTVYDRYVYFNYGFTSNENIDINGSGKGIHFGTPKKTLRSAGANGENVAFYDDAKSAFLIDIRSDATEFKKTVYTPSGTVSKSDKNSKHDINTLDNSNCKDFIMSLKPSSYKYNDGTSNRFHHGFIAQEVKEAMGTDDWGVYVDTSVNSENSEEDYKALRYEEIIADLVGAVQHQQNEIEKLKQQLATLTERMDRYEQGL